MYRQLRFHTRSLILALFPMLSAFSVGCFAPKREPEVASSSAQPGYALEYPATVEQSVKDFGRYDDDAGTLAAGFAVYAKDLKAPDWKLVADVERSANDAGRSQSYVDRNAEVEGARAFFTAEQEEISKKVGGWVSYACKQKGGNADLSTSVSRSLSEVVAKHLERRLRERNAAFTMIDRHRNDLTKEDAAALEVLADQISHASYLVHIAMVQEKVRIRARLEEAEQVKKTLVDYVAEERAIGNKASKEVHKIESDARIDRANQAKAKIDGALSIGREMEKKMEQRISAAQKRHKDAVDALVAEAEKKGK